MSSSFGRKVQAAIDRMRGESAGRSGGRWAVSGATLPAVEPTGELETVFYGQKGRIAQDYYLVRTPLRAAAATARRCEFWNWA